MPARDILSAPPRIGTANRNDPPDIHRIRPVHHAVRPLRAVPVGDPGGRARRQRVVDAAPDLAHHQRTGAGHHELPVPGAVRRCAAAARPMCRLTWKMGAWCPARSDDAARDLAPRKRRLARRCAGAARAGAAQWRRRRGARGRRRRPQRADGAAAQRHRYRHHGGARGGDCAAPRPPGSRRCRPASITAPSRW